MVISIIFTSILIVAMELHSTGAIMDGSVVFPFDYIQYSFQVQLAFYSSARAEEPYFCSGTIINNNNILTAAHCVIGLKNIPQRTGRKLVVVMRSFELDMSLMDPCSFAIQHKNVKNIRIHEKFDLGNVFERAYDIALIRLPKFFNLSDTCRDPLSGITRQSTAAKLSASNENYAGVLAQIAGWGVYSGNGAYSPWLRETELKIMSGDFCSNYVDDEDIKAYKLYYNHETMMCAYNGRGDQVQKGDSGSPVIFQGFVIGITTMWGRREWYPGFTLLTRISHFSDWIQDNMFGKA